MSWLTRLWPAGEAAAAWWRTRRLASRLRTRRDIDAWQRPRLQRLQQTILPGMAFYAGAAKQRFVDLPIVDKAQLMGRFADFNRLRLTAEAGWRAIAGGGRFGSHFVGASTGTSGNRGLYVISEVERWRWLGTMVAKTMPRLRRARVALVLPLDTALYAAARNSHLIDLRFFDLGRGLDACAPEIARFDPDTLIAPPRVLRWLASGPFTLSRLHHVFSAAEVLDPLDRAVIEARYAVTVREIYMATEGLLGVACEHGTLHLCEDTMKFEFEPVAGSALVSPIITDFSRDTQAMVRYRLNDLLALSPAPCPCGSPLIAVAQVHGRIDDMLHLPGAAPVTPDILRNAIVDADRRIDDFRLAQTGPAELELALLDTLPGEAASAARQALSALLASIGVEATITVSRLPSLPISAGKLRRIERRWRS
jgi:putative adenylate-forming enzyme